MNKKLKELLDDLEKDLNNSKKKVSIYSEYEKGYTFGVENTLEDIIEKIKELLTEN